MSEEWQIIYYQEVDGTKPVEEFFNDPSLTKGESKQFQLRLYYLKNKGLALLVERSDILDKIETENNLYELRLDNTPNNIRVFLCALPGKRLILLHAFKKKGDNTPIRQIKIAAKKRDFIEAKEDKTDE
ncbi:MAG: type II toxin-antitoxin system RelE/ParE family toxin [Nostoc sp. DedQUE08]|uniref:type II toxin-antitoxin system RelE/ParE family toxin n=1 Tax=unclassified Nostoc TaxID=2593658 RepID=UPI002AD306CD|nr:MULTISPECIES: type II toxin-antitoxin system RelE/ParE family toxin [unclassified Nostoc]MDZ8070567.1 type II toxin-antitoxin system RelE/ParE family toxin [Nostoc sp. DedQUE08]MDZ8096736.1 type II toxin-antitoxin system RelE/ParE family toxin [Nostoc sp. DedQUE05]